MISVHGFQSFWVGSQICNMDRFLDLGMSCRNDMRGITPSTRCNATQCNAVLHCIGTPARYSVYNHVTLPAVHPLTGHNDSRFTVSGIQSTTKDILSEYSVVSITNPIND